MSAELSGPESKPDELGVLLVSLGTPVAPEKSAIRSFLRQFLSDRRVVEIYRPLWLLILYAFILPFRPGRLVSAYEKMWKEYGDSPLRLIARKQAQKLEATLQQSGRRARVISVMTYALPAFEPGLAEGLESLQHDGYNKFVVLPLYPQYSATTTAAVYDQVRIIQSQQRNVADVRIVKCYYRHPLYQQALCNSVIDFWKQHGRQDKSVLLMSYHGIPRRNVELGDPYREQCEATSKQLALDLQLDDNEWRISFQSRLGRAEWLQPYTTETLLELASLGVKNVDVICPSFSADCLETLEEISIENAEIFKAAGGQSLRLIPSLNDSDAHIDLFRALVES